MAQMTETQRTCIGSCHAHSESGVQPLLTAPGCPCTALHLSKEEGKEKQIHCLPHAEGDCVGYIYKIIFIFTNTLRSKHYLYFRDEKTEPSERLNIQLKITTSSY